jgi:hypothetical protein
VDPSGSGSADQQFGAAEEEGILWQGILMVYLVSPDEVEVAAQVILPVYDAVRDVFADEVPRVGSTKLVVTNEVRDSERHYAGCREDGSQILVAPEAANLSGEQLVAILAHELGHAADFLYPACWRFRGRAPAEFKEPKRKKLAALRSWHARSDDEVELMADAIAWAITGQKITYCGPCLVQCFSGIERPRGLR